MDRLQERLSTNVSVVESLYDMAFNSGMKVIVLRHFNPDQTSYIIHGFETPEGYIEGNEFRIGSGSIEFSKRIPVEFSADEKFRLYGYVIKTEENMRILAHSLKDGHYGVVDQDIYDEVVAIAESLSITTTPLEQPLMNVVMSQDAMVMKEVVSEKDAELLEERKERRFAQAQVNKLTKEVGKLAAIISSSGLGEMNNAEADSGMEVRMDEMGGGGIFNESVDEQSEENEDSDLSELPAPLNGVDPIDNMILPQEE